MGNLIKDFWTLPGEKYTYGIVEVVRGKNIAQNRANIKIETHIEKALNYTMQNDVLSHISIQTYSSWLRFGKPAHENWEKKYYPFVLEFEPKSIKATKATHICKNKQVLNFATYEDAACEAAMYVNYLVRSLNVNKDDILIMANNSRSIYVFVNPKSFNLRPDSQLQDIYWNMYLEIKEALGFTNVDESIVKSTYKIMKTPNSLYKGGYFVPISIDELMKLMIGDITKSELTKKKRTLDKNVPGQLAFGLTKLYSHALKKVKNINTYKTKEYSKPDSDCGKCVFYFMKHMLEKGYRNYAIVSVSIYLKDIGYTQSEVLDNVQELAERWNYKENVAAQVKSVFRNNYHFSCKYAQAVYSGLGIDTMCGNCIKNKTVGKQSKISVVAINPEIIDEMWENKASTRHYMIYLQLIKENMIDQEFSISEYDWLNERSLRELKKISRSLSVTIKKGVAIVNSTSKNNRKYYLPVEFIESSTMQTLGENLKFYMKLFIKGYKSNEKYIMFRMNVETIQQELGYKDISSVYKLIKRLKSLGLIKSNNNLDFCLYYKSYKVIEIRNKEIESVNREEIFENVVGYQEVMNNFENSKQAYFNSNNNKKITKQYRGSPEETG